jgi:hypothetical protein
MKMLTPFTRCTLSLAGLFAIFFAILLAAPPAFGQRLHPRVKAGKAGINRLVILPIEVSMTKDGMKGQELLEKESAAALPAVEKAIAGALAFKKLTVLESPFKPEALQNDEKLKYAVADLQRNYKELLPKISKKKKDVDKGRFTLGDHVLMLNQDDSIDAFVFLLASGQKKTGGKKALGIVMMNPLMIVPVYFISIGIVDARNGEILAYNEMITASDITKDDGKSLTELLKKGLKKMPNGEGGNE